MAASEYDARRLLPTAAVKPAPPQYSFQGATVIYPFESIGRSSAEAAVLKDNLMFTEWPLSAEFAQALVGHKSSVMTDLYRDNRGREWTEVKLKAS